ncbi:MAG: hypothetical protein RLY92_1411, partial [Chloroflexota bacterium]
RKPGSGSGQPGSARKPGSGSSQPGSARKPGSGSSQPGSASELHVQQPLGFFIYKL